MESIVPDSVRNRFATVAHSLPLTAGDRFWNMSLDQAILESVDQTVRNTGKASPVIRFYTWQRPTLSLGYFQPHRDALPRFESVDRVRRATGGGAILHHRELTYSITVPVQSRDTGSRQWLYRSCHGAIAQALRDWGIGLKPYRLTGRVAGKESSFLCFQRRTDEDLILNGYKIVGSAQRRAKDAVLQHGSVLLAASEFADELPGVFDLTGRHVNKKSFSSALTDSFTRMLGLPSPVGIPEKEFSDRAETIAEQRFGHPNWWQRR
jgi:lipoate-protein ligase A